MSFFLLLNTTEDIFEIESHNSAIQLYTLLYTYIYIFLSDSECEAAVVLYWPGFNGHVGFELQLLLC